VKPADASTDLPLDEHRLRPRLIGAVLVTTAVVSLLLAVPALRRVASTIAHISPSWLALALCSSSHRAPVS
jgi:hypothetical protein